LHFILLFVNQIQHNQFYSVDEEVEGDNLRRDSSLYEKEQDDDDAKIDMLVFFYDGAMANNNTLHHIA
jgi:uncharacterized protein (DUF1810 family)